MFENDRKTIENKYHIKGEKFNPYIRMAYHGYEYDKTTGKDDGEITDGLKKLYDSIKDLPHPQAKAYAVKYVLENFSRKIFMFKTSQKVADELSQIFENFIRIHMCDDLKTLDFAKQCERI